MSDDAERLPAANCKYKGSGACPICGSTLPRPAPLPSARDAPRLEGQTIEQWSERAKISERNLHEYMDAPAPSSEEKQG